LTPTLSSTSHFQIKESLGSNGESVGTNIECIANETATNLKDNLCEEFDPSMPVSTRKKKKRDEKTQDEEKENISNVVPTGKKENADNEEEK
jgi:hypothetical protein